MVCENCELFEFASIYRFIDDKIIYGDVKEKEEAKVAFKGAKSRGESAGHLAQK